MKYLEELKEAFDTGGGKIKNLLYKYKKKEYLS